MPDGTESRTPPLVEGVDYYVDRGMFVFTAAYHLKRGHCCESGCRHCPYRSDLNHMAHRIRLGPPWEVTTLDDGRTRHARRFGKPRLADPKETSWLVVESLPEQSEAFVNEVPFKVNAPFAVEITQVLNVRNEVVFLTPANAALGAVALEIRTAG